MKSKLLTLLLFCNCLIYAQEPALQYSKGLRWPKDSAETKKLFLAFEDFLKGAQISNTATPNVPDSVKAETYVLLDEIRDCGLQEKTNIENYYKATVIGIVALLPHRYLIQWQYATGSEKAAQVRAIFEVLCFVDNEKIWFYSPLNYNTRNFQKKQKDAISFTYAKTINTANVDMYFKYAKMYDEKLSLHDATTHIYCFENLPEMSKACGVIYKADYNGIRSSAWTANAGSVHAVLLANKNSEFNEFDPHDLFHERLGLIKPRSSLYRPVDEGCAYLYGGSWGYSWPQILEAFKKMLSEKKQVDWYEVKEKPMNFKTGEFNNSADYVVNALIVQKLEKEKGFEAVWQLLNIGPAEPGHASYYAALEKLLGVQKQQYQAFVDELVRSAK